jgi:predicted nucleic acid-binding protein
VISELRKKPPYRNPNVHVWSKGITEHDTCISALTIEELELGILGKQRKDPIQAARMRSWFEADVLAVYIGRILPFDTKAALLAASYHTERTYPKDDARIAAIAAVNGLTVVTRNVKHFAGLPVDLLNPFD